MAEHAHRRPPDLVAETRAAAELARWLRAQGVEDEESIELSILSETDLAESCAAFMVANELDDGRIEAINTLVGKLQGLRATLRERKERRRTRVVQALQDVGRKSLPTSAGTLSVVSGKPRLRQVDPSAVPAEFVRVEVVKRVTYDEQSIAARFEAGEHVPGYERTNGEPYLMVRS